jgi:hypothetical protein
VIRPTLEVADIFRDHGAAWRRAHAGHVSLGQLKVMSAIESCRTAALGGHVARCEKCAHIHIAYNSCRNRRCPKCQAVAAKEWLAECEAELLPVPYYHVVFTLPAPIADIAYQNKAVIYDALFRAAAETLLTIAADPKHLGARIGLTAVLHTWGSALTHHPHVHFIVPGGGISLHGQRSRAGPASSSHSHVFIDVARREPRRADASLRQPVAAPWTAKPEHARDGSGEPTLATRGRQSALTQGEGDAILHLGRARRRHGRSLAWRLRAARARCRSQWRDRQPARSAASRPTRR